MQRVSMQLADQLEENPEVELIKLTRETGWRYIGIKTTLFLIRLFLFLPAFVRKNQPDIILFSSMATGSVASFIRKRIKIPMVSITHGHDVTVNVKPYQWLVPRTFRALDGVISVSSATRQVCLNRGLTEEKSKVLPNGFNMRGISDLPTKEVALKRIEKEFGFKLGKRKLLLTVGRLIKRKGHVWFIEEVLPQVKSDVLYIIVGDGPEKAGIREAMEVSGQQERILHVGRQPDLLVEYAYVAADLFVIPNIKVDGDMEGFGVVLLEANVRQTPAIASNLEGIRDVISQGINGYRIKDNDAAAFASKIDRVLEKELDSLSLASRVYAEQQFNWVEVGKNYVEYLKEVCGKTT